jgi:hypothetical protein
MTWPEAFTTVGIAMAVPLGITNKNPGLMVRGF